MIKLVLGLLVSNAIATDCDLFAARAYELQLDRQYGVMSDWKPDTAIEWDMKNEVWHHPQFRGDEKKVQRARLFSDVWREACTKGWYN